MNMEFGRELPMKLETKIAKKNNDVLRILIMVILETAIVENAQKRILDFKI